MKLIQAIHIVAFSFVATGAIAGTVNQHHASIRYSMFRSGIDRSHVPDPVSKAACTGPNTCCCRTGTQLFCTTPDACSKMGGACSAGCY